MKQTTVADVMTRNAVVARENAEFKDIVGIMRKAHVSALPVLDAEDRVIGVVSEGDLLVKEAAAAGERGATDAKRRENSFQGLRAPASPAPVEGSGA